MKTPPDPATRNGQRKSQSWPHALHARGRLWGLVIGVSLFLTISSTLSPVDTDIAVYWKAAQRVFDQGTDPYLRQPDDVLPFTYPPTALFLVYPFSWLDLKQSARLILMVNLFVLLFLWLYWRQVRRSRRTWSSGIALAFGCVAKPHYGLLLLGTGPRPGYRIIAGASIAGVVLLGTSLALAPEGSWKTWVEVVLGETSYTALPAGHSSIAAPWNRAIPGSVARFFVPNKFSDPVVESPAAARYLSTALILILLTVSAWTLYRSMRRVRREPVDRDLELSLISVFVFLSSPASWTHHLVMLLPAALVMLRDGVLDRCLLLGALARD